MVTIRWDGNATGDRVVSIQHDQDGVIGKVAGPAADDSNQETEQTVAALADLAENEYVYVTVGQQSGGDLNVSSANSNFSIIRITGDL
jgi:hypothetical protein